MVQTVTIFWPTESTLKLFVVDFNVPDVSLASINTVLNSYSDIVIIRPMHEFVMMLNCLYHYSSAMYRFIFRRPICLDIFASSPMLLG